MNFLNKQEIEMGSVDSLISFNVLTQVFVQPIRFNAL